MSFPQLGYPQYLSAAGPGAYGGERPGVLAAAAAAAAAASSGRPGAAELGAGAGAAAVTSVLGMYAAAGPYAGAPNYSAFLPYAADLSLFSQMVSAPGSRAPRSPGRPLCSAPAPRPGAPARRRARGTAAGGRGRLGRGARAALPAVARRRRPGARKEAGGLRPRHLGGAGGRPAAREVSAGVKRPPEQARGARPALEVGAELVRLPGPAAGL